MDWMQIHPLDVEAFRAEIQRMDDAQLERFAQKCAQMAVPQLDGEPPHPTFMAMLDEIRAEWDRRKPIQ